MPSVEELVKKYEEKSNEELVKMHLTKGDFTSEAIEAMEIVFQKKGGIELLLAEEHKQQEIEKEKNKIRIKINSLVEKGTSESEILTSIHSDLLQASDIEEILQKAMAHKEEETRDVHVNERTLFLGFWGGLLGGTIAAIILAVQIIISQRLIYFLVFASFIIPYLTIKGFTNQSYKNVAVLLMSLLSFVYACILCTFICKLYGINF